MNVRGNIGSVIATTNRHRTLLGVRLFGLW
jgi:hypothetical protein